MVIHGIILCIPRQSDTRMTYVCMSIVCTLICDTYNVDRIWTDLLCMIMDVDDCAYWEIRDTFIWDCGSLATRKLQFCVYEDHGSWASINVVALQTSFITMLPIQTRHHLLPLPDDHLEIFAWNFGHRIATSMNSELEKKSGEIQRQKARAITHALALSCLALLTAGRTSVGSTEGLSLVNGMDTQPWFSTWQIIRPCSA